MSCWSYNYDRRGVLIEVNNEDTNDSVEIMWILFQK